MCEILRLYLLNLLTNEFGKNIIGLDRMDDLSCFQNTSSPDSERIKRKICKIFKENVFTNHNKANPYKLQVNQYQIYLATVIIFTKPHLITILLLKKVVSMKIENTYQANRNKEIERGKLFGSTLPLMQT